MAAQSAIANSADLPQSLLPRCEPQEAAAGEPAGEPELEPTARGELLYIVKLGVPLALSQAAKMVQDMTSGIMLGRYDTQALAAVAVCGIWTSVTDIIFYSGLGQLSTLASEADGAGNKALVGTWLQIFLVFLTIASIPVCALRFCTAPILRFAGIDDELAELASEYAIWSQFGFVFDMWYFAVKEYYAAQLIVYPVAVVDGVFIFVNAALVAIFVYVLELGVIGAAIATTLTRLLRTVVFVFYCWCRGYHRQTWKGWSCKEIAVRSRWCKVLWLVVPAGLGGLAEELQFEFCAVLAGRMGPVTAASVSLILNLIFICFLGSLALGDATGIRMARFLGEGRTAAAHFVTKVGILAATGVNLVIALLLVLFMGPFGRLASTDEQVSQKFYELRWITALTVALIGVFFPIASVLTKSGRAWVLAVVVPLCCWLLGFPVTIWLSASHGIIGIFEGVVVGYSLSVVIIIVFYLRSDWSLLSEQARERAEVGAPDSNAELEPSNVQRQISLQGVGDTL